MNRSVIAALAALVPALASAFVPHSARAADCIVDIALAAGKDNYRYNGGPNTHQVGWWQTDSGGAHARGQRIAGNVVNLSAISGPMSGRACIEAVKLRAGPWDMSLNPPFGFEEVGYWDIDDGGALDSDGGGGDGRMTLFVKKMDAGSNAAPGTTVLRDLAMTVGDNQPNSPRQVNFVETGGPVRMGWWDVGDGEGGCGFLTGRRHCGRYGASLSVVAAPFDAGDKITGLTLTGKWENVNECRGEGCAVDVRITVGVEQGEEISSGSSVGMSLSTMLGAAVTGSTGAIPGGEVSATVEITGGISRETSDAIARSFSRSRSVEQGVSCTGQSALWQWVSTLQIERPRGPEEVEAGSLLTRCAPLGERPPRANDISWGLNAPQAPAPAAASAPAQGRRIAPAPPESPAPAPETATAPAPAPAPAAAPVPAMTWAIAQDLRTDGTCVNFTEPSDMHSWLDNYLCFETDIGARWSFQHPIPGMTCTQITAPSDPEGWTDNYFCLPEGSPYRASWTEEGSATGAASRPGCIRIHEPLEPVEHGWTDSYLCIE